MKKIASIIEIRKALIHAYNENSLSHVCVVNVHSLLVKVASIATIIDFAPSIMKLLFQDKDKKIVFPSHIKIVTFPYFF